MTRIILIGYMGVGKTTVGRLLAQQLRLPFYDLDWYIESRRHKSVAQIFEEEGEEAFRRIEYNMLHELAEFEDVVISCGGGTPCFFDNIGYMNRQGHVVYLKATPHVICQHLRMARVERPLLKGKTPDELTAHIERQLREREPYYSQAAYTFEVSTMNTHHDVYQTVDRLLLMLGGQPSQQELQCS